MPIEITARHMEISSGMQEYSRELAESLMRDFPRVEHVHIILDEQKHIKIAEVVVQAKNHIRIEAMEKTDKLRTSIDSVIDKMERQLRKHRDKAQDHKLSMKYKEAEKTGVKTTDDQQLET